MKNFKFKNESSEKAFTLIEAVIAVGLFSMVMMVALAIILSVVDNNKKVHSVNVVVDNLNFAIDSMVRDIKTGRGYRCTGDQLSVDEDPNQDYSTSCSGPTNYITLISTLYGTDKIVQYKYDSTVTPGKITKSSCDVLDPAATSKTCRSGSYSTGELTSSEIDIREMKFYVNPGIGGLNPVHTQPSVFVLIKGTGAINPTSASDFYIQTLISQRRLNI